MYIVTVDSIDNNYINMSNPIHKTYKAHKVNTVNYSFRDHSVIIRSTEGESPLEPSERIVVFARSAVGAGFREGFDDAAA